MTNEQLFSQSAVSDAFRLDSPTVDWPLKSSAWPTGNCSKTPSTRRWRHTCCWMRQRGWVMRRSRWCWCTGIMSSSTSCRRCSSGSGELIWMIRIDVSFGWFILWMYIGLIKCWRLGLMIIGNNEASIVLWTPSNGINFDFFQMQTVYFSEGIILERRRLEAASKGMPRIFRKQGGKYKLDVESSGTCSSAKTSQSIDLIENELLQKRTTKSSSGKGKSKKGSSSCCERAPTPPPPPAPDSMPPSMLYSWTPLLLHNTQLHTWFIATQSFDVLWWWRGLTRI